MKKQNQIKRTLTKPESIKKIKNMLDTGGSINRTALADRICSHFNFFDPSGNKQRSGCIKALRNLEKAGHFTLPCPAMKKMSQKKPRRPERPVPEPKNVPASAGGIDRLQLIIVKTREEMQIWNELMIKDHPRGAGPLVGRQIRYLIQSEYGYLGGISFSSSALHLDARDRWIGWDWEKRQENLHYIVNMSRFLIRSNVSCKNLASYVLGLVVRKFPGDFEARYGHRPLLLESFVDTFYYSGTCFKAANWQWVGRTKGIGRQGLLINKKETIKDIYVYVLDRDFRTKMGLSSNSGLGALDVFSGIDSDRWAENEFKKAPLGDKRLSKRLIGIGQKQSMNPACSYSGAAKGSWTEVKGYYRFIEQPDDSAVTMENILLPHREQTIRRMKAERRVLVIQDGSDLNFNNLNQCEGLGLISSNQTGAKSFGLHLHSSFVVNTSGLPLGVLRSKCSAPKPKSCRKHASKIPIEEKKTFCWVEGMRDCQELKKSMPHTAIVSVMDREGDFFELFDDKRINSPDIDLIVRAKHDRATTGEHRLFETAKKAPVMARIEIKVPGQSSRSKKSKQKARPKRTARTAEVSVHYAQVELVQPEHLRDKKPLKIGIIHIREDNPPENEQKIEWFLLTTVSLKSVEDILNCIKWYCLRWRIEDWHRVLKSGCNVEELANKTTERLKRAVAIKLVIAWRIMLMTLLGREAPNLPAGVMFSDLEIKVLSAYVKKKNQIPLLRLEKQ